MAKNSPAEETMLAIKKASSHLPAWGALLFVPFTGLLVFIVLDIFVFGYFRRLSPNIDSSMPAFLALGAMFLASIAVLFGQVERKQRSKRLKLTKQTTDLTRMSWQDFEHLVADAYKKIGYQVTERGGGAPDGGVDLEILTQDGRKGLIQCKRWTTKKVGVKIVRELLGVLGKEYANFAVIITCGDFTQEAITFATGQPIDLINGPKLIKMLESARGEPVASKHEDQGSITNLTTRTCPKCGEGMVRRTSRKGPTAGTEFYGCSGYPNCRHTENIREASR